MSRLLVYWPFRGQNMKIAACLLLGSFCALAQDGAEVFRNHCSTCHRAGSATSAPLPEALRSLPAQTIVAALESGKMRAQGSLLSAGERTLVANYLGTAGAQTMPASASCPAGGTALRSAAGWNGWSPDPANSRFQRAAGRLTRDTVPKLALRWAFG